ncbi:2-hydroxyacid dehydrogenase [Alicyclobacillus dauci]|uniref:D-glycerate dehydrogenase n=1 Tax=Alicyclobacillus dauci TaxID=1475485 RepID=A0ABY6Z661_9BACL|nr:D-glycerate dehydrogenase [Alicyclobacillus dauci]WAH38367.1 D-glycerate dehydrogenase [Alicyclobacillus dauci]
MFRICSTRKLPQHVQDYLTTYATLDILTKEQRESPETFVKYAADADGIITSGMRIDDAILSRLPKLKCVSTSSVGYDHFDTDALKKHGVYATHTPTVLDETVADLTFALILATARRVVELDTVVREGRWAGRPAEWFYGVDVHHRTLGIIGMGRIGEAVARRARLGFEMDVVYHNRSRKPEVEEKLGLEYVSFEELLAKSDFVVLLTPLTEATRGLMDDAAFQKMKSSAIFINVSRGATVNEQALFKALSEGTIRAAGLDVFVKEPTPTTNPLLSLQNVVVLPHIGSATHATRDDMAMLAATNLIAVLEGRLQEARIVPELQSLIKES